MKILMIVLAVLAALSCGSGVRTAASATGSESAAGGYMAIVIGVLLAGADVILFIVWKLLQI